MLKIAVCDDEPLDLNRIQDLVSEYIKERNLSDLSSRYSHEWEKRN